MSDYTLTDVGNGLRFVAKHGQDVRYNPAKGWLIWNDKRWEYDEIGRIMQLGKATVREIYCDAAEETDELRRKALASHAKNSESIPRLQAMITSASTEDGIPILPDALDADPWLFNTLNGTVDLRNGELREHKREDLISKLAPVEYNPDAICPMWDEFLRKVMGNNENLIGFLRWSAGYSLTGTTSEQVLFVLHGTGANGKSTFVESIAYLMGDYSISTPISTFTVKQNDAINNDIARLQGARYVSASESEAGSRLAESVVKQVTGGDVVVARFLHKEFFQYTPKFKILFSTNHKPSVKGTDHAIWRYLTAKPKNDRYAHTGIKLTGK